MMTQQPNTAIYFLANKIITEISCSRLHQVMRQYRGVPPGGGGAGQGEDQYRADGIPGVQGPDSQPQAVAERLQEPQQGEDGSVEGREAEGRPAGGRVQALRVDHEHLDTEIHEEGRNSQIWRLCGHHSQPYSSILYVTCFCYFLIVSLARLNLFLLIHHST